MEANQVFSIVTIHSLLATSIMRMMLESSAVSVITEHTVIDHNTLSLIIIKLAGH